jgi:hypothetical protein
MVASLRPQYAPKLVLVSPHESIESGVIVGLLVEQQGQVSAKPVTRYPVRSHEPISLFDEPVTWEDAEWQ